MKRIHVIATIFCLATTGAAIAQTGVSGQKRTPEQHSMARQCAKSAGFKIDGQGNWHGSEASPEQQQRYKTCKQKKNIP